jgi:DNA-binding transcriptional MerR regulator
MISIGEAAIRSGITVATIRYYEEVGLIPAAKRTTGGRRVYSRPDVDRLRLIRRLRSMEFGLDTIKDLLTAMAGGGSCLDVRDVAKSHLEILRRRRVELDALERTLAGMAVTCSESCADGPSPDCTLVGDLAR